MLHLHYQPQQDFLTGTEKIASAVRAKHMKPVIYQSSFKMQ